MSYLSLLKALLALGPKLPEAFQRIQRIIAEVQELWGIVKPQLEDDASTLQIVDDTELEPSDEEAAAEAEVFAALTPSGSLALGDGAILRKLFGALASNPELWALIIGLLSKKG